MKRTLIAVLIAIGIAGIAQPVQASLFGSLFGAGSGTIGSTEHWVATTTPSASMTQKIWGKAIQITGLSDGCLYLLSGLITSNTGNATCTGGAGGASGGSWSTTTSTVSGQLINYPNNTTDIVTIGANATTSAEWWYDPNTFIGYIKGKLGIGTTSPFAKLSIQAVNGETNNSLLNISSSTASVTVPLLDFSNTGMLTLGTTSPTISVHAAGARLRMNSDTTGSEVSLFTAADAAGTRSGYSLIRSKGSVATPLAVVADDSLGFFGIKGYDGVSSFPLAGMFECFVDGTVGANSVPTRCGIVTGSNSTDRKQFFTVGSTGNVGVGVTTTPAFALSVVGSSGVVADKFTATSTVSKSVLPYASTTAITASHSLAVTPLTSAITLTGADGTFAEYAGASCTNQFVRSLSALGAATCATVGSADVSLANLTATDSTLTFSGTYTGATARTIGLNLTNANVWTGAATFMASTTLQNFTGRNATTTNATSTTLAAIASLCLAGDCRAAWPSSSAVGGTDTQVQFNDGGSALGGDAGFVYNKTADRGTLTYASTTAISTTNLFVTASSTFQGQVNALQASTTQLSTDRIYAPLSSSAQLNATTTMGTGTTTATAFFGQAREFTDFGCTIVNGTGNFTARLGNGTASSSYVVSTTGSTGTYTAISPVVSLPRGTKMYIEYGSVSGTVSKPTCSYIYNLK